MKTIKLIAIIVLLLFFSCKKEAYRTRLPEVKHLGIENLATQKKITWDSIVVDMSETSLVVGWHLYSDTLYILDRHMVPMKKLDLEGNYIESFLKKGRGPNELTEPFFWFTFLPEGYAGLLSGYYLLNVYDKQNQLRVKHLLFSEILDTKEGALEAQRIFDKPDPESYLMYEPQTMNYEMVFLGNNLILPVVTEHYAYNGFNKYQKARKYYRDSYLFLRLDTSNLHVAGMFGHYPQVFQESNIPNFSNSNFSVKDSLMFVSFMADPNVYVYNDKFELSFTFGVAVKNIKGNYPETKSFEEAEEVFGKHRKNYGHYKHIRAVHDYIFRMYMNDHKEWRTQVYDAKSYDLVADFQNPNNYAYFKCLGYSNGYYYAEGAINNKTETSVIYKFKID